MVLASLCYSNHEGTLGLISQFHTHPNQSPIKPAGFGKIGPKAPSF
ncbi:hypothetical protein PL9631_490031 [Planktothrix paucivesiculata PCC 9631]|uniref:Uncharacterized protein n=1 Tax=Planktothrix paucivesiculata PCC 9631 TaxID=671071 RepID=A0A7Z9BUS8_9CYAN|nr:hypothetical protein PL9631_490031 [Planktothrix paucivesiculata PCC 9631]